MGAGRAQKSLPSGCEVAGALAPPRRRRHKLRVADEVRLPPAVRKSARLHQRVRLFAEQCSNGSLVPPPGADTFESLALDIAQFQFDYSAGFARLVSERSGKLETLDDIPPLPTDAFRFGRVAMHPPDLDEACFITSGTTATQSGRHPVRDLSTKEELTVLQASRTLFSKHRRGIVVALAPRPTVPASSSLTHMMQLLMERFDGRPLSTDPDGAAFDPKERGRWLSDPSGIDVEGLSRAIRLAIHRKEPLFILATSFALLATLEALDGQRLRAPARTVIMLTGGFKGRKTTLDEGELRSAVGQALGASADAFIGEYGMTELSSQLFEGPRPGTYLPPPWLRVRAVDPTNHRPLPEGALGLAHFIDLANVDSSVSVLAQDLVRVVDGVVELHGRSAHAVPRGCSLPYEGLLLGSNLSTRNER